MNEKIENIEDKVDQPMDDGISWVELPVRREDEGKVLVLKKVELIPITTEEGVQRTRLLAKLEDQEGVKYKKWMNRDDIEAYVRAGKDKAVGKQFRVRIKENKFGQYTALVLVQ